MALGTSIIAAKANVTTESLMEQAQAILEKPYDNGQMSAAVSALKEKGILSGKSGSSALRSARRASSTT
jgi:hypothetical protein